LPPSGGANLHWQSEDRKTPHHVNRLIEECARTLFGGTGKSERLRGAPAGWWSRRITLGHRLVYRPTEDSLQIAQCRYRY